ncbi:MAG: hypothetical protein HUU55_10460 [Myxococcales bacterium]|nr:hypothetical protein [Myxococcales bacterium]
MVRQIINPLLNYAAARNIKIQNTQWSAVPFFSVLLGLVCGLVVLGVGSVTQAAPQTATCLSPPADFNGDGVTHVGDLQCQIMVIKAKVAGLPLPDCLFVNEIDVDLDCNQNLTIVDVQLCIVVVLGPQYKWPSSIDADKDFCADACKPVGPACDDPTRTLYSSPDDGGCSVFASSPTDCLAAYQDDPDSKVIGATTTCYYDHNQGNCFVCDDLAQDNGQCGNSCAGPLDIPSCLNPDRTVFLWGNGIGACQLFSGDAAACETAYHLDGNGNPAACTSVFGGCNGTGGGGGTSTALNDCIPTPTCDADPTRTLFVGGPNAGACGNIADESDCNIAFHMTGDGDIASCFWDGQGGGCLGCGGQNNANCFNTCAGGIPVCENNPDLVFVQGNNDACAAFDNDPAGCMNAFVLSNETGQLTSCYYGSGSQSACAVCSLAAESAGQCTNSCVGGFVAPVCAEDPSRTLYVFGGGNYACHVFDGDPANCEMAYHWDSSSGDPASCYYDGGSCLGCGENNWQNGNCINTCNPVVCEGDPARNNFVGGPNEGACGSAGSEEECNQSYHLSGNGTTASCFWDEWNNHCYGCASNNGTNCINTCNADYVVPSCTENPELTFAPGFDGTCHSLSGSMSECTTGYGIDPITGQAASCYYDFDDGESPCRVCDSNTQANGQCANSCMGGFEPPVCEDDSSRTIYLFGNGNHACHLFDGDQTNCEMAYHWDSNQGEPASCYYDGGSCVGCGQNNWQNGNCVNTCNPVVCEGDSSRTNFVGGPNQNACRNVGSKAECDQAYHLSSEGTAASCYWDDWSGQCYGCASNDGTNCVNTCIVGNEVPQCANNPGLTFAPGNNGTCSSLSGNVFDCNTGYGLDPSTGQATSCYYDFDAGDEQCRVCDSNAQANGHCANSCVGGFDPPVCEDDGSRTIYLFGTGNHACHVFDGDQANCEIAYHWDSNQGEPASCYFDGTSCVGCGQNNWQNGNCINTCNPVVCEGDPNRTEFVGGPSQNACRDIGSKTECDAAYHLSGNGSTASCFWDEADLQCYGCASNDGINCINMCIVGNEIPSCDNNPELTFTPGFNGSCSSLSGNIWECNAGYGIDPFTGQAASCYYNPNDGEDSCKVCSTAAQANGYCGNSCVGGFEIPVCEADDTRTTYLFGSGIHACHVFDNDPANCETAYHWDSALNEPASCFYNGGSCQGCGYYNKNGGNCVNTCNPIPTCEGDSERMIYVGGPNSGACGNAGNQQDCEQAYHLTGGGTVASCHWDVWYNACFGCGTKNGQSCINTCDVNNSVPGCDDNPEFTFAVGFDNFCASYNGSPDACLNAYGVDVEGTPTSCYVTPGGGANNCNVCQSWNAASGHCANLCNGGYPVPQCEGDPARTVYLFGNGNLSCSTYNGDPAGCAQAYHFSALDNAVASCRYDDVSGVCAGCGSQAQSFTGCINTCAGGP